MTSTVLALTANRAFGQAGALLALAAATVGILCAWWGMRTRNALLLRQVPRYAYVVFGGAALSVVMMQRALAQRDWSISYVQQVGSDVTPTLYNIAAMWSSLEGSVLLWLLVLAGFVAVVAWRYRARTSEPLVIWAVVVLFFVVGFFALLAVGPASPFTPGIPGREWGPGPNALLQNHILVLFHPPIIYLGFTGLTVPFAFAIAALITGRVGEGWLIETRRWALFGWAFLTIGVLLGGWWSYEVLGWGGVWGWDPVENISLLPWLTATAYIHSVLVQERRGMLRVWNLSLLIATFALTILGTYLTRSGLLNSVHAFGDGPVGNYLLVFFAIVVIVSLLLIGWRGDRLRSPGTIDSPLSREAAFLVNNVVFALFAFVVFLGTLFPLLIEAFQDRQIKVGAPYFDRMSIPIGLTLLFLMAVAPVLPWRKASEELLRQRLFWPAVCGVVALAVAVAVGANRWASLAAFGLGGWAAGSALRQLALATRRQGWRGLVGRANGGMIVHLGVIMIAVALAAYGGYSRSATLDLTVGNPIAWGGHTFELTGVRNTESPAGCVTTIDAATGASSCRTTALVADVVVDGTQTYSPAVTTYTGSGSVVPTPSVRTSLTRDVYLTLDGDPEAGADTATIVASIKPMIIWLWIGGAVMLVGTVLSMFPGNRRRPTAPVSEPVAGGSAERPEAASSESSSVSDTESPEASAPTADAFAPDGSGDAPPARSRIAPFIALGIAAIVGVLIFVFAGSSPSGDSVETPLLGRPAPAVSGETAPNALDGSTGGATWDLGRQRGDWVVLNFFDATCIPCVQEHPELVKFAEQQAAEPDGAELVSIVFDNYDVSVDWLAKNDATWTVVAEGGSIANAFAVAKVPETWIIDPAGFVQWRTISTVTAEQLDGVIAVLSGEAPAPTVVEAAS